MLRNRLLMIVASQGSPPSLGVMLWWNCARERTENVEVIYILKKETTPCKACSIVEPGNCWRCVGIVGGDFDPDSLLFILFGRLLCMPNLSEHSLVKLVVLLYVLCSCFF